MRLISSYVAYAISVCACELCWDACIFVSMSCRSHAQSAHRDSTAVLSHPVPDFANTLGVLTQLKLYDDVSACVL
eukprot:4391815-Pleurochrysis_carterae.AAC.2